MHQKMNRKERESCDRQFEARLKAAGATFPDEEFESSGTDSSSSDRDSRIKGSKKKSSQGLRSRRDQLYKPYYGHIP